MPGEEIGSLMRAENSEAPDVPLCVALDRTLVRSDTLLEQVLHYVKQHPFGVFKLFFWYLRGKPYFKKQLGAQAPIDVEVLPFDAEFLSFLREERRRGRRLLLVTSADAALARQVADHVGLFDKVLAGNGEARMDGPRKLAAIRACCGGCEFDYAGGRKADLAIWRQARFAVVVGGSPKMEAKLLREGVRVLRRFPGPEGRLRAAVSALRPSHWSKNILVFVPLIPGRQFLNADTWIQAGIAFFAFCLCASSGYIMNDLLDLNADRRHHSKQRRPFAAGILRARTGLILAGVCLVLSLALSFLLSNYFAGWVASYLVLTVCYSLFLKTQPLLDVFMLAGLYTLRIFAGAEATGIVVSKWLAEASMFSFTSLAFLKRFAELRAIEMNGGTVCRRDYDTRDIHVVSMLGIASGYAAAIVVALYVKSPEVMALYRRPNWLWILCPLTVFAVSRLWLLAQRGRVHEDPLMFVVRDRGTYWITLAGLAGFLLSL